MQQLMVNRQLLTSKETFYDLVVDHKFKYIHCCNSGKWLNHHDRSNLGRIELYIWIDPAGNETKEFKQ
ncbi:MAG: hypothetical protein ACLRQF_19930 [Thomasclavelia ramosa]